MFTKGAWKVKQIGKSYYVVDENDHILATVSSASAGLSHPDFILPAEANAHLIAQSPRMAEWIAKVARQDFITFPEDRVVANKIISKVRGE